MGLCKGLKDQGDVPPFAGWQPNLNSIGTGYFFLVDNFAQAAVRNIKLGNIYLEVNQ